MQPIIDPHYQPLISFHNAKVAKDALNFYGQTTQNKKFWQFIATIYGYIQTGAIADLH